MTRTHALAALAVAMSAVVLAQEAGTTSAAPADGKLQPWLRDLVRVADPHAKLPVYFVLRDRLGYEHWFPRVFALPLAARRAVVIGELRTHAARTQQDLLAILQAEAAAGDAANLRPNWLGNFVQAEATPLAILTAASDPSVAEVWFDGSPPRAAVEDGTGAADAAAAAAAAATPTARPMASTPRIPGDGPSSVYADRVWTYGIEGQGVLVINTDSGIASSPGLHGDLANRLWTNPGEIPGNNLDDDLNGLVDDVHGWNFGTGTNQLDDGGGHGTNTSGCIAADGSCNGVTYGMAPQCTLMIAALGSEASQWAALQYGLAMGADVQTSSHSYKSYFNPPPNYRMHRDVGVNTLAAGQIRTNSTSNDGGLCGNTAHPGRKPCNISAPGNLPPPYLDPNQTLQGQLGGVLGVAAWDYNLDALKGYSPCGPFAWHLADVLANVPAYPAANWDPAHDDYPWTGGTQQGLLKPDVAAPAGTTTTAGAPCGFAVFSGTSNATPCASGVIVLWKSANPSLTPEDVGMIVHQTARDRGTIPGKENDWGAGVVDAEQGLYRALCVHRVDGQSAWRVQHAVGAGALAFAVDGVPQAPALLLLGFVRQTIAVGPVTIGVGHAPITLAFGITDAEGDLAATLPTSPAMVGLTLYSQALLLDQTVTGRVLASNVVGTAITP